MLVWFFQERVRIQTFETSKISEGIFQKQTLVTEGLIILGKYILAPEFLYEKQRNKWFQAHFFWQAGAIWL